MAGFPRARMILVADPVASQHVAADRMSFRKPIHYYGALALYGMNVAVTEGEAWRRHRKIIASSFTDVRFLSISWGHIGADRILKRTNVAAWRETSRIVSDCLDDWAQHLQEGIVHVNSILELSLKIGLFVSCRRRFSVSNTRASDVGGRSSVQPPSLIDPNGKTIGKRQYPWATVFRFGPPSMAFSRALCFA